MFPVFCVTCKWHHGGARRLGLSPCNTSVVMQMCRFKCDRKLENKTVPYTPVDDGLGWHQVTRFGCARAPPLATADPTDDQLLMVSVSEKP